MVKKISLGTSPEKEKNLIFRIDIQFIYIKNLSVGLADSEILELLTTISRELVCLHETDGTYLYVSPNAKSIIGYDPIELLGKNPYDFFHPDDRRLIFERAHQPLLQGAKNINPTFRFLHKNGTYIWLQSDNRLITHPNSGKQYLHTSSRDISEKIESDANLALSERKFKTLFKDSPIGLVLSSKQGYIDDVNESFAKFLGYETFELLGKHFSEISSLGELEENLRYRDSVQKGMIDHYSIEKQYLHKQGHLVWAYITVTVLRNDDGQPIYYLAQIIDIDERKKTETLLLENNEHLKATKNSLLIQNKQLQSYNQIISHHLRAPVSNLRSLVDLLKVTDSQEERQELQNHLEAVTESLETVLSELITTLKIQNLENYHPEWIPIKDLVSKVCKLMEGELAQRKVQIESNLTDQDRIFASKDYLETLLIQLFSNSIQFADQKRELRINIESFRVGTETSLSFSDNGTGIDLSRYGDQIFQMKKTFHRHMSGKGLGLFLMKYMMESMGGRVDVTSKPDEGATFLLHFPNGGNKT
ncbi:PAS domain S-box protein [Leptospira yanagawae serovar Saopaulo str. Sao Paulo = ATCC 700523]|uniref:histidine kinase n=1 Tax=Leptospira yanagawae serovar Saopaulo str. Sao Paulo = ATCC 700523 TaxID=1249483 RepID=A0A5E8HGT6_9LEPT|nr:PAS domain S-box protein [Leptospira yanagawae serovar Saopaulo str. Sao Paulo = ATCC 700523]